MQTVVRGEHSKQLNAPGVFRTSSPVYGYAVNHYSLMLDFC